MKRVNFIHPTTGKNTIGILHKDSKLTDKRVKVVCLHCAEGYIEIRKENINNTWDE